MLDHQADADHHARPARYDVWRDFVPPLTPPPGPDACSRGTRRTRAPGADTLSFPAERRSRARFEGLWSYRRILDRTQFTPSAFDSDLCVVNWVMLDLHRQGDLATAAPVERTRLEADAREQTRSLVYWLQTEAPRPDGGAGWPGLRLRGDVTGTFDGLAKSPYIRESRRLRACVTVTEQHVSPPARPASPLRGAFKSRSPSRWPTASASATTASTSIRRPAATSYIDVPALPFQIPLGALIPIRLDNLLPAAKESWAPRTSRGMLYRLHPVEWNVGEGRQRARGTAPCRRRLVPGRSADGRRCV